MGNAFWAPALLLATFSGHAVSARQPAGDFEEFRRMLATLAVTESEEELARAAAQLARLPDAVDAVLEIHSTGVHPGPDGEPLALTWQETRLLDRTAENLNPVAAVEHVRRELEGAPLHAWNRGALRLLGLHATSTDLHLFTRVLKGEEGVPSQELVEPFQDSLTLALRRLGCDPRELDWLTQEAESMTSTIARAVGKSGDPEGLVWLAGKLHDPVHRAACLQEIGRLAPLSDRQLAREVSLLVQPFLSSRGESLRRHAIRAVGALRAPSALASLVPMLEAAATDGERRMVHAALRNISGIELPDQAAAWRRWREEEERWYEQSREALVASLASEEDTLVIAAVHALSAHRLYRGELAPHLVPLLNKHVSPTVRRQVCLGLAQLGSDVALPALIKALRDNDLAVVNEAHVALRRITGCDLPADVKAWRRTLDP